LKDKFFVYTSRSLDFLGRSIYNSSTIIDAPRKTGVVISLAVL